ncbi:response regulator [Paenibacillus xanthanilyticus]|uniref:Response regulator n=1 Tax=Paenibacillus xanthanilyticus TaxID=1783531 RepID=A0ABV8K8M5_9BACL
MDDHKEHVRLCVIDDIRSVVEGLSALDWEAEGVQLAGTAYNGEDGLALIQATKPDLILTDIRMPKMDGLTMLQKVLELNQACKVILISSYTDFDYARQAVQLGAFDFVVKPFTEEDILAVVRKARAAVLQERTRLMNEQEMERKLKESMPLLRQEYMELLLSFPTAWQQAAQRWAFLGMSLKPEQMAVLLLEIDDFQEQAETMTVHQVELTSFAIQNVVEETLREYTSCLVYRSTEHRFVAVVNAADAGQIVRLAEQCCEHVSKYAKLTLTIGAGGLAETLSGLPESRRQAEWALAHRLYTTGNSVIGYDDVADSGHSPVIPFAFKDELLLAIRSGNGGRAVSLLDDMSVTLEGLTRKPSPDYWLSLYEELAASVIRTLFELGLYHELKSSADRLKGLQRSSSITLAALKQHLTQLCMEGAELVRRGTVSEGQAIIYKSLKYVNEHLDREVTVTECAAHVHLSASYYSSLFKKVMGVTLTQYIASERIRRAKTMLIDGVPVQEIALMFGYEERRYFSDMFKRATGMTPSEFRESYMSGSGSAPQA